MLEGSCPGPWFWMCNISYPEVLDSKQAVRGLSDASFICYSQSMIELHDNGDMKEVLNLLTISELCEISSALMKDRSLHKIISRSK